MPFTGCIAQKPIRTPRGAPFGWSMAYVSAMISLTRERRSWAPLNWG